MLFLNSAFGIDFGSLVRGQIDESALKEVRSLRNKECLHPILTHGFIKNFTIGAHWITFGIY